MTTTYELYTNENGTPKAVEGKAPAIIERVEALETGKANAYHTHTSADVTDLNVTISNALKPYATTNTVNTELAKKANESHTHAVSDVDGLQVALDGKLDATAKAESAKVADSANSVSWDNVTGKPSIPSSPRAYITETWHSGASWYRKWSDGFIEQSGTFSGASEMFVNLITPFSTITYAVFVNTTSWDDHYLKTVIGRETSRFRTYLADTRDFDYYWYACGY